MTFYQQILSRKVVHNHQKQNLCQLPRWVNTAEPASWIQASLRELQMTSDDSVDITSKRKDKNNKLAPYGTNGRLIARDFSAKFKVTWQKN